MNKGPKTLIEVKTLVNVPLPKVWNTWTNPNHIIHWNSASADWHTTKAENDLRVGGKFTYRMEAKDESFAFDFSGIYTKVSAEKQIEIVLDDERKMSVAFLELGVNTEITEVFEAEKENPIEMQRLGWQAILDSFKSYVESLKPEFDYS